MEGGVCGEGGNAVVELTHLRRLIRQLCDETMISSDDLQSKVLSLIQFLLHNRNLLLQHVTTLTKLAGCEPSYIGVDVP